MKQQINPVRNANRETIGHAVCPIANSLQDLAKMQRIYGSEYFYKILNRAFALHESCIVRARFSAILRNDRKDLDEIEKIPRFHRD